LPVSIGEVISAAKRAAGVARVSLQDAVRQILEGQRDTAKRVAGDWMDHRARIEINNMNLGSSPQISAVSQRNSLGWILKWESPLK
jgi:hypothetical protein